MAGEQKFNVLSPFVIDFDIHSGLSDSKESSRRYLSDMKNMYFDDEAYHQLVKEGDPLVYEFYELDIPRTPGDIAFGTTVIYPGKVGREYFMTKGHFHEILDTAEIYYCLSGRGYLLMENTEGDWTACELAPGKAVYVPAGYAHRSINTGSEPFVMFFAFRADAGHDYGTIKEKGFRELVVEEDGKVAVIDNPKWKN